MAMELNNRQIQEIIPHRYPFLLVDIYPGLRIGGSGGFNAFDITRFLMVPASLVYDIAAGITAPVFEAGRLRKEYSSAVVKRNMAVNSYKETVIKAYSEVAGLADATENLRQRIMLKKDEMRAGKRATESANELFRMQFIPCNDGSGNFPSETR